ncbi:MAG TPA: cupin domain-containing protein [Trebonia sp.]|nr:cupin domain-containing protein [Trebonia sp.]
MFVRSAESCDGKQGVRLSAGINGETTGSQALSLHLVMIPPGTRGMPHYNAEHESAIYAVSGETEVWHGDGLLQRTVVRAGDFMYVPPGTPHLPVNRGGVMSVSVVARTDPQEQESMVIVELPRHLADLLTLPVAIQE